MMRRFTSTLAAAALASAVLIAGSSAIASANHRGINHGRDVAAIESLQARFHASVSGGGHIDDLMALWADDATFTNGAGTVFAGKDAIRAMFLQGGGFKNDWVSVTPAFKTRITVRGHIADLYFECHFVDYQANPQVVVTHGTFTGTAKKVHGHWLFFHVTAGTTTLTP